MYFDAIVPAEVSATGGSKLVVCRLTHRITVQINIFEFGDRVVIEDGAVLIGHVVDNGYIQHAPHVVWARDICGCRQRGAAGQCYRPGRPHHAALASYEGRKWVCEKFLVARSEHSQSAATMLKTLLVLKSCARVSFLQEHRASLLATSSKRERYKPSWIIPKRIKNVASLNDLQ